MENRYSHTPEGMSTDSQGEWIHEDDLKTPVKEVEPSFWTEELVLEFARQVWKVRESSECWTEDLTAERSCLSDFIFNKKLPDIAKKHKVDLSWMAVSGSHGFEVTGDFLKDFAELVRETENGK